MSSNDMPPILAEKHYEQASVFVPENLLREARRQKQTGVEPVPDVCVLDPDGDIVRRLTAEGRSHRHKDWACYHTDLHVTELQGIRFGVIGCAVGASFAVLLAEQLFASGCRLLLSVTSSGQLTPVGPTPYFVLIDRALRDEGTSYHYMPASRYSDAPSALVNALDGAFEHTDLSVQCGATWTTDAPYRETATAIEAMTEEGLLAVEMEAAALYAFAQKRNKPVICFAHVTNRMAQEEGDFEKGAADGTDEALALLVHTARHLTDTIDLDIY